VSLVSAFRLIVDAVQGRELHQAEDRLHHVGGGSRAMLRLTSSPAFW
jgi:hypothetical protein